MPKSFLVKRLTKIAAKVIQDTRTAGRVPPNAQDEYELVEIAYGGSAVENDFEKWLNELKNIGIIPTYPVTEYLKVIKDRLQDKSISEPARFPTQSTEEGNRVQNLIEQARLLGQEAAEKRIAEVAAEEESAKDLPADAF